MVWWNRKHKENKIISEKYAADSDLGYSFRSVDGEHWRNSWLIYKDQDGEVFINVDHDGKGEAISADDFRAGEAEGPRIGPGPRRDLILLRVVRAYAAEKQSVEVHFEGGGWKRMP